MDKIIVHKNVKENTTVGTGYSGWDETSPAEKGYYNLVHWHENGTHVSFRWEKQICPNCGMSKKCQKNRGE